MGINGHEINDDDILEGPFWNEHIIVKGKKILEDRLQINGVGERSNAYFETVLDREQLDQVKKVSSEIDFSGKSDAVFLALSSKMIEFAHQFNPLYAVNYSQIT
ncbi:MAG: hypothetical protein ACREBJ_08650, partial [Nitrosotalea sp.]